MRPKMSQGKIPSIEHFYTSPPWSKARTLARPYLKVTPPVIPPLPVHQLSEKKTGTAVGAGGLLDVMSGRPLPAPASSSQSSPPVDRVRSVMTWQSRIGSLVLVHRAPCSIPRQTGEEDNKH